MPVKASNQSDQHKTVLFVDDEPLFLEMVELLAHEQGTPWEVLVASTAQRALEIVNEQSIDLAVIDLRMPVMDGLQLLGVLQRLHPQLVKVVLTGFATDDSKAACLSGGANFFLEKPQSVEGVKTIFATLQELMSVQPSRGFRGMLVRVDLPEVVQMECLSRHSSILEVITDALRGEIFIKDGSIIHAQTNTTQGEPAFQQLLALSGGEFRLKTYADPPQVTIQGSWEFILMEAARQRDEAVHANKDAGSVIAMRELSSSFTSPAQPAQSTSPPQTPPTIHPPGPAAVPQPNLIGPKPQVAPTTPPPAQIASPAKQTEPAGRSSSARIEETVVCSPQGDVLHEWQCASVSQRLQLLKIISETAMGLDKDLAVGPFKRLEIDSAEGRLVVAIQNGNQILVRSRRSNCW
jgi:CheY-like chemotaxis protein